jgi:ferritin-like metal-binding protein YciE
MSETIKQAVSLLDQTLQQEKKTDFDLTKIAETAERGRRVTSCEYRDSKGVHW